MHRKSVRLLIKKEQNSHTAGRGHRRGALGHADSMTESFARAVSKAISSAQANGHPVARYDREAKRAYLEYPDGRKVYQDEKA